MKFTVQQIAQLLGGKVEGDDSQVISTVAKIDGETPPESIGFLANPKYEKYIYETSLTAVLVTEDFKPKNPVNSTLIYVKNPYLAFTQLLKQYETIINAQEKKTGIDDTSIVGENTSLGKNIYLGALSYIGKNCKIGDNVSIAPHCFIGDNVDIDDNTTIHAGVRIYKNTVIGKNCTFLSGVVIGGEGFGFALTNDGSYEYIPQLGNVIIEDNVNIGANTTIDRATLGSTIIRKGVKLDNLIQIGHNVEIGENTVISSQTGISGSTKIGKNCLIAGQVGLSHSIKIADGTKVGAQSGIGKDVKKENTIIQGYHAFNYKDFLRSTALFKNLPHMHEKLNNLAKNNVKQDEIQELKERVKELEEKILNLPSS